VLTALSPASMALVERDLKRILAFSTVSQLGFMMAAVGAGAPERRLLPPLTHAFFKALLFSPRGILIHAVAPTTSSRWAGLARSMPVTAACFAVGALAWPACPPLRVSSRRTRSSRGSGGRPPVGFALS
jgi:NADH-quinone oxidoreductase subunit L